MKQTGPHRAWLPALLLAFAALAALYSLATPVFEGPDEIWHYAFASHLAGGGGLPVLSAADPNLLLRNAAHPPLYYLPVAGLIAPLDRQDFPTQFRFNLASPHITPGSTSDRPNLLIHTAHEDWPYRQSVLAVHLGRLVSIALATLTLWGVYAGVRRLLPGSDDLALLATALAAFVPQFVYGAAVINNDSLAAAAGAWLLVALLEMMTTQRLRWAVGAGLLLGVALLSKIGMVALLPLPVVAVGIVSWRSRRPRNNSAGLVPPASSHVHSEPASARQNWQGLLAGEESPSIATSKPQRFTPFIHASKSLAAVYGIATLVAGWWYLRNWRLYGDPLAWREWQALAGVGREGVTPAQLLADLVGFFGTFWADFGMRADRMWLGVFVLVTVSAAVGLALRWRHGDWPVVNTGGLVVALAAPGLLLVSAGRYALVITDIHGRLLYPAMTIIAAGLALGLTGWGPRVGAWLARGVAAGLFVFAAAVPFMLIGPAFARPTVAGGGLPEGATPLDASFGGAVALAGYELRQARVAPGEAVALVTYWRLAPQATAPPDTFAVMALVRPDGVVVGRAERRLGSTVYPSSVWQVGDLIRLEAAIPVDTLPDGPVVAEVWLGVRADENALLPAARGATVSLGRIAVSGPPCALPANAGQTFDGQIRLVGYQVGAAGVSLCWEALRPPDADYTVFVHLLDAGGNLLASGDSPPRGGLYPTSAWLPGETVEDWHPVPVPPGARVQIGLYRLDSGERLPVDGTGQTTLELAR